MAREDLYEKLDNLPEKKTNFDVLKVVLGEPTRTFGDDGYIYELEDGFPSYFYKAWLGILFKGNIRRILELKDNPTNEEVFNALFGDGDKSSPEFVLYKFGKGRYSFSTLLSNNWLKSKFNIK